MGHAFQRANGRFNHPMGRLVVHLHNEPEAAAVALEFRAVEPLLGRHHKIHLAKLTAAISLAAR
jgi:hypothetical protein